MKCNIILSDSYNKIWVYAEVNIESSSIMNVLEHLLIRHLHLKLQQNVWQGTPQEQHGRKVGCGVNH